MRIYDKRNLFTIFGAVSWFESVLNILINLLPCQFKILVLKMAGVTCNWTLSLDQDFYIRAPFRCLIGSRVAINRGCRLFASLSDGNGCIKIGDDVTLSPNVTIYAIGQDPHSFPLAPYNAPIVIENESWICANAVLLPGVTIGRGAVIAAGAVVASDVPQYEIWGGIPARKIGCRELSRKPSILD